MKNQIIFIGNYSSGKSSLINFLFDAKIRITKLDDTNQKLIEEVPKKIYGKTILDVAGLNVGKRNIEQIKDEIKYSHMVFIVCKYDSYKSRDTEEYIQKCKEYRQGIAKKNIYIVITHADIIYEKESELFRTIEDYFKQEEGFYFVDAVSKNPNWGFDLKKKIELELYSEWIIKELEQQKSIGYNFIIINYNYCYYDNKFLNCSHTVCKSHTIPLPSISTKKSGILEKSYISVDFGFMIFVYKNLEQNNFQNFAEGHAVLKYNEKWFFISKRNGKIYDYLDITEFEREIKIPELPSMCAIL